MNPDLKDSFSLLYYTIGAVCFVGACIRVLYSWFRDSENSNRFAYDMAMIHLPYINKALNQLAEKHGIILEPPPIIRFQTHQA